MWYPAPRKIPKFWCLVCLLIVVFPSSSGSANICMVLPGTALSSSSNPLSSTITETTEGRTFLALSSLINSAMRRGKSLPPHGFFGVSFHWIDLILWPLQTCKWSSGHEYCSSFWRKHGMNNDALQLLHTSYSFILPPRSKILRSEKFILTAFYLCPSPSSQAANIIAQKQMFHQSSLATTHMSQRKSRLMCYHWPSTLHHKFSRIFKSGIDTTMRLLRYSTRDIIYQRIPPKYGLCNGCIGQYRVILGKNCYSTRWRVPKFSLWNIFHGTNTTRNKSIYLQGSRMHTWMRIHKSS